MNHKKGFELVPSMLITILIVLISFGLIFYFVVVRVPNVVCDGDVQVCRTAILAANAAKEINIDLPTQCPGKDIQFTNEEPAEVNAEIASEIEKCIFKFHEGKIDFSTGKIAFTSDTVCFRCAGFDFSRYGHKEEYHEANNNGQHLLAAEKQKNTVCASPKVKLLDYFNSLKKDTDAGKRYMYISDPARLDIENAPQQVLFISIWKRSAFERLGLFGAKMGAAYAEYTGQDTDYYKQRKDYVPVASNVILTPVNSPLLQECDQFYQ